VPADGEGAGALGACAQPGCDAEELAALRRGDQAAFTALVRPLRASMVRVATSHVSSPEVGEDVAQDTWLAVIEELS